MYFNHSLAGAVAIKPIIDKIENKFTEKEKTVLWFVGITASVLPDFDIAYSVLKNLEDHRSFVTHGVILYIVAFLLLYSLSFLQKRNVFGKKFFKTLSLVFLIGVSVHLLIDFFVGGIALYAPFSYKICGFDMVIKNGQSNRLLEYLMSKYMILEFFIAVLFFIFMKGKKYFIPRVFALFYVLVAISSFVFVSLSFF